jgi:polyisoprenoid-binding protein YceI
MNHRLFTGLGVALALYTPASAGPAPLWTIDKANSKVGFTGSMNGEAFAGSFRSWDANIAFDPKNLAGSKVIAVINVASIATGNSNRDEALPTADWFSAKAFPRAIFAAQSFKDLGGGRYQAIGELSIRGVKRPLVLPFQLAISGNVAKMHGAVTIDRSWFGVGRGQWATGDAVATKVPLDITVTAHR